MTTDQSAPGGPRPTSRNARATGGPAPGGTDQRYRRDPGDEVRASASDEAGQGKATGSGPADADRTTRKRTSADDAPGKNAAEKAPAGKAADQGGVAAGKAAATGKVADQDEVALGKTTDQDKAEAGSEAEAKSKVGDEDGTGQQDEAGKKDRGRKKASGGGAGAGDSGTPDGKPATDGSKPDGTPAEGESKPDPWAAFGPAPEPVPTWYGRLGRWASRLLIHEWTLAAIASLALAVLMTWPTLRYPAHTLPQDYWDPSLQAWQMAWSGHILLTEPAQLWHANAFFPERWSFAFSDTLLGYAPAGMIGSGPEAALVRYNIMFVLAHALATFGAYVLARQLGASRTGSAVAGVAYTYAPWLLAQAGHLHVVSNGGIPLALAMLARGHGWSLRHGYRPERRHEGWVYAGWLVAAWQLSLGFGIGLPFAYVLAGTVLVAAVIWYAKRIFWRLKRPFGQRLFVADLIGGLIFAGVGVLMAIPYFTVTQLHPNAERTIGDIAVFSPPASGFVTAPAESRLWGGLHEGARSLLPWHPEMTLLPGFVLYALALGGLFFSIWKVRQRLLLLAGVLVAMALSMGTELFGGRFTYVPLFDHLPGWSGIRTPGRLMLWATLLLGLLAAGAVSAFAERVREISAERIPSWPSPWLRLATLVPLLLVIAEGTNTTPHPVVPAQPAAMRSVDGPLLVLPSGQNHDQPVMLWSTTRFQDIVNGGSGFTPRQLDDVRRVTMTFPDQTSVDYLRTLGVHNVLVLRDEIAGTPWEVSVDAPVDGLGITREEIDDVVVFRL
ncbi:hypothetical protein [Micromonospora sediminimaris]|uniref:Uncharacterized protein n=1 Tax=Micromonospora sediminimaris TaxID=547162 RepID=A0A9W5USJ8_9ACTN|nr:hypothetical protein [Micromonospora sediminimaris]GIJ33774.1 hypothetical protein Vse01_29220 [Micromonospora sediminimaris]SFD48090.1 hypothetical protein SAMN05216284_117141 [Micromonospora sediminimaris]